MTTGLSNNNDYDRIGFACGIIGFFTLGVIPLVGAGVIYIKEGITPASHFVWGSMKGFFVIPVGAIAVYFIVCLVAILAAAFSAAFSH